MNIGKNVTKVAAATINRVLSFFSLELSRKKPLKPSHIKAFDSLEGTLREAAAAGLSVGDHFDMRQGHPTATQDTIDRMVAHGVFTDPIDRVCEIGPGSGRYLARVLSKCSPSYYEIYEPAKDWADWLVQRYRVVSQPCDGLSLGHSVSESSDLVQAHKVFVALPFMTTCRYFNEMARVVRPGGRVVFDIVTEDCMSEEVLAKWIASGSQYPTVVPKAFAVDYMRKRGLSFVDSFRVPLSVGLTECMIFLKKHLPSVSQVLLLIFSYAADVPIAPEIPI